MDDNTWLDNLRWRVAIRLLRYAVAVMPDGSARMLLHELHQDWIGECRRQWTMRYGADA